MRYLALDPGGTTGYVVYDGDVASYGHLGPDPHHWKLWRLLLEQDDYMAGQLQVICERFDNRANPGAKLISLEYIGIVNLYQQMVENTTAPGIQRVFYQGSSIKPGKGKSQAHQGWATDEKLIRAGLLQVPKTRWVHANDAMRHLLYFFCHNSAVPTDLKNYWTRRVIPPA